MHNKSMVQKFKYESKLNGELEKQGLTTSKEYSNAHRFELTMKYDCGRNKFLNFG